MIEIRTKKINDSQLLLLNHFENDFKALLKQAPNDCSNKQLWDVVSDTIEFVGDLIKAAVDTFIDLFTVQQEVKQRVPSAFKILIMKKKRNAIDVGIFNKNSKPIRKIEIKSDYGISKELVVGQEYILQV